MVELGLVAVALLVTPHAFPLHRVAPRTASVVWLGALGLRAVLAVGAALAMLAWLPTTAVYATVADVTLHRVVPYVTTHFDVAGDPFAHAAAWLPIAAMAASVLGLAVATGAAAVALRTTVRRHTLAAGPRGSVVVADRSVYVALTALGRPQLMVSDVAVHELDGEELDAALAHETGHLRRGHRPASLVAAFLASVARLLPGTGRSERALRLSLERDADEYATAQTGNPLALASAICKAAVEQGSERPAAALGLTGQGGTSLRLDQLLGSGPVRSSRRTEAAAVVLAGSLAVAALAAAAVLLLALAPASGFALALGCS